MEPTEDEWERNPEPTLLGQGSRVLRGLVREVFPSESTAPRSGDSPFPPRNPLYLLGKGRTGR